MKEKRSKDFALGTLSSRGQGAEDRAGIRNCQSQSWGLKLQDSVIRGSAVE